jgi:hypothetical protein
MRIHRFPRLAKSIAPVTHNYPKLLTFFIAVPFQGPSPYSSCPLNAHINSSNSNPPETSRSFSAFSVHHFPD